MASVSLLEIEEVDHFNLVEKLSDPQYKLTQVCNKICEQALSVGYTIFIFRF